MANAKHLLTKRYIAPKKVFASYDLVDKFGKMNCCSSLDMEDHKKSRGQVFEYLNRFWVCTGSRSRGQKYLDVNLHECVALEAWNKPFNDVEDDDADYYKGGRFRGRDGKWWVMTGYEIELVPLKNERSLFIKEKL